MTIKLLIAMAMCTTHAAAMKYTFPISKERVEFNLVERPHGTIILVQVDWGWPMEINGRTHRTHHIEFTGGLASSETGYRSHFTQLLNQQNTEDDLVNYALDIASRNFNEMRPKGQFSMFDGVEESDSKPS